MPASDELDLLLTSFRSDNRPAALIRDQGDGQFICIAASVGLCQALDVHDELAIGEWASGIGGCAMLENHASTRQVLAHPIDDGRNLVLSVRKPREDTYELRGKVVGEVEVSNTMTAGVIASIANDETGIIFLDANWRVLAVNEAFYQFFPRVPGYPKIGESFELLLEASIDQGYLPRATGRERRFIEATLSHFAQPNPTPLTVHTGNGHWINTSRLRFRNGAVAILLINITEHEKQIAQYKSFIRNTRDMTYVRLEDELSTARVWGEDAASMVGVAGSGDQVDVGHWRHTIHPDDLAEYEAVEKRRRATGQPYRIEFRFRHPVTGEDRWMMENAWVAIDDITGEKHFDSYLIDITDRKLAESRTRESEGRLQAFSDMAVDWYFEIDTDLNITYLSDGIEEMSGTSADWFIGRNWEEFTDTVLPYLPKAKSKDWYNLLDLWRRGEAFRDREMQFRFPGGDFRQISLSSDPIYDDDGRYVGSRGVGKDVTRLVEAQANAEDARLRAETANLAKSKFIANMSHELRTPLNAIIGFASVMEQQMFGPIENRRYRDYAGDISASGQHLLSLVNDILDLSRIEADRQIYDPEWLDLKAEVSRVCTLFREEAGARQLLTEVTPEDGKVWADRRALRQILINLAGNAIKFTPDDGDLNITASQCASGVTLAVIDNGAGMSEADIELALEPFGRAASSDVAGGTGLGLPISRKLAELHGGSLQLEATPGEGTSVSVFFPSPETATNGQPSIRSA